MSIAEDSNDERRPAVVVLAMRRRWRAIVATAVILAALAGAYSIKRSQTYTAMTTVFVRPLVGNAFTSDALSNNQVTTVALNTEASLVDSAAVTDRVNAQLGTHLSAGSAAVHASVPLDTQLVLIQSTAGSADTAKKYAGAYASAFLDYRAATARASQQAQLKRLTAQADDARDRLEAASKAANQAHPPADAASELQLASSQLGSIQSAIGQAQTIDTNPGSVVKPAHVASASLLKSPAFFIVIGLLLGLVIGFVFAVWRELRDDRIRASEDAEIEGLPVLGVVPANPDEPDVRDIRTGVLAAVPERAVIGLAPLTAAEADATARVAVRLACSLAAADYRVALVDATVVEPRVGRLLHLRSDVGLSDVLASGHTVARPITAEGIQVVPAGSKTTQVKERYGGAALATVIAGVHADADYTIAVTPALDSSDGVAVLHSVDQLLLVATDAVTHHGEVRKACELLSRLGRTVVGLVLMSGRPRKPDAKPTRLSRDEKSRPALVADEDEPGRDAGAAVEDSERAREPVAVASRGKDDVRDQPDGPRPAKPSPGESGRTRPLRNVRRR